MIRKSVRGVIRGRTIELESESGFAEGEGVEVDVRPLDGPHERRTVDAEDAQPMTDADWDEWDAIMREIHQQRKIERRSSSEEE